MIIRHKIRNICWVQECLPFLSLVETSKSDGITLVYKFILGERSITVAFS